MVPCPKCGAPLERRTAKSAGRTFYGCTRYFEAACRGSMEEMEYLHAQDGFSAQSRRRILRRLDESESKEYPKAIPYDGELVSTAEFEHPIGLNQPGIGVEFFNPPQSQIVRSGLYRKRCNLIITTPTSSGKTCMAEMVIARQLHLGRRAVYISPLKAVTSEKHQEWTDSAHPFSQKRICIMTGDHRPSDKRLGELASAEIILMTSEMLDSRSRKAGGEDAQWMDGIGVCVVDEAHLLGTDRGPALEVGLMRFTEKCPARLVFLSATLPNTAEVQQWLTSLNGMQTVAVDLPWRPIELRTHWLPYEHSGSSRVKDERFDSVREIVLRHREKGGTIVFVHTKRMGREMRGMLERAGVACKFHSGELDREARRGIEARFRSGELRVLISTSTLAWGCNL